LLALLGAHHILHISRIRVKQRVAQKIGKGGGARFTAVSAIMYYPLLSSPLLSSPLYPRLML